MDNVNFIPEEKYTGDEKGNSEQYSNATTVHANRIKLTGESHRKIIRVYGENSGTTSNNEDTKEKLSSTSEDDKFEKIVTSKDGNRGLVLFDKGINYDAQGSRPIRVPLNKTENIASNYAGVVEFLRKAENEATPVGFEEEPADVIVNEIPVDEKPLENEPIKVEESVEEPVDVVPIENDIPENIVQVENDNTEKEDQELEEEPIKPATEEEITIPAESELPLPEEEMPLPEEQEIAIEPIKVEAIADNGSGESIDEAFKEAEDGNTEEVNIDIEDKPGEEKEEEPEETMFAITEGADNNENIPDYSFVEPNKDENNEAADENIRLGSSSPAKLDKYSEEARDVEDTQIVPDREGSLEENEIGDNIDNINVDLIAAKVNSADNALKEANATKAAKDGELQKVDAEYIDVMDRLKILTEKALEFAAQTENEATKVNNEVSELDAQIAEKERLIAAVTAKIEGMEKVMPAIIPERFENRIHR